MASITTNTDKRVARGLWATISAGVSAIGGALVRMAENTGRVRRIERLNAMSDAELAEKGLKREDIVRHVFRDLYYV